MSINEKLRSQQNDELFTAILTLENTEECYETWYQGEDEKYRT